MSRACAVCAVVLLVGCGDVVGSSPDAGGDVGLPSDAAARPDASLSIDASVSDASSSDGGFDAFLASDAGGDAARVDAAVEVDAGAPDAWVGDAGSVDAFVAADAGSTRGAILRLGVNGGTSCVLTSTMQMWCWGGGATTPAYVADAVDVAGNCGIGTDGRVLCWTAAVGVTYAVGTLPYGSDAAIIGAQAFVGRTDGAFHAFNVSAAYAPAAPISEIPAVNCAIDINGGLSCWDRSGSTYSNFWNAVDDAATYDATDVARAGTFSAGTFVACYAWTGSMPTSGSTTISGPQVSCYNAHELVYLPSTWVNASEVDMDWGRTCVLTPTGVHCVSATLTPGVLPSFVALAAGDAVGTDIAVAGATDLQLGYDHACVMQSGAVLCWGNNDSGQLGNGTTTPSSAPRPIAW